MVHASDSEHANGSGGFAEAAANGAANECDAAGAANPAGKPSPLDGIETQFSELLAYVAHYAQAQSDWIQWRALAILWRATVLVGAALAVLGMMVTAAVLLMLGLAHGMAAALGDRAWAGELGVGAMFFLLVGISQAVALGFIRHRWRERILRKYGYFRQRERDAFGHDIDAAARRRAQ